MNINNPLRLTVSTLKHPIQSVNKVLNAKDDKTLAQLMVLADAKSYISHKKKQEVQKRKKAAKTTKQARRANRG